MVTVVGAKLGESPWISKNRFFERNKDGAAMDLRK